MSRFYAERRMFAAAAVVLLGALVAVVLLWRPAAGPKRPAIVGGQVVSGQISYNVNFNELVSSGVILPFDIPEQITANLNYSNGTGSNQVDTIYAVSVSLAGTPTTLNLQSLTDPAGVGINFARVRELIVVNPTTTAGFDVKIEAAASNGIAWLPSSSTPLFARYGGSQRISDPISTGSGNGNVITSSSKQVTLDPGTNTVTVYLLFIGGSAASVVLYIPRSVRRPARRRAA
jgi:hypothetical protein